MKSDLFALLLAVFLTSVSFPRISSSKLGYLKSDSDSDRYIIYKRTRQSLLKNLKCYFKRGDDHNNKPTTQTETDLAQILLPQVDPECESPETLKLWDVPKSVQFMIEKYLNTKDSFHLSYTCKYYNGIVRDAANTNLSLFCPHFVLPDLQLNRIFYFGIIKDLRVDNLKDPKIHDAFEVYHIQQLVSKEGEDSSLTTKSQASGLIIKVMRVFLYHVINGLNCRIPVSDASHFEQFKDFIQTHGGLNNNNNCSMTLKYIQSLPTGNVWKEGFDDILRILSYSPAELKTVALEEYDEEEIDDLPVSVLKTYIESILPDLNNIDTDFKDIFECLLCNDIFIPKLFERLHLSEEVLLNNNGVVMKYFNMDLAFALISSFEQVSGKSRYLLTRTATDPFNYQQFRSISGGKCLLYAFCTLIHCNNLNLAHNNTLLQLFRHRVVDLATLQAPHRSLILRQLLSSPKACIIFKMFQYEIPNHVLYRINLFVPSLNTNTHFRPFCSLRDSGLYYGSLRKSYNQEAVIGYFRSISDDPLPVLLLPESVLCEELIIQNKFNLDKKYLFDYDRNQVDFFFFESRIDIDKYHGTVVDFKTIVKSLKNHRSLMSLFTSNIEIFNDPTPEDVKPISLKAFIERAAFEEVDL